MADYKCYGKYGSLETCGSCPYADSCRYSTEHPFSETYLGGQNIDDVAGFAEDLADHRTPDTDLLAAEAAEEPAAQATPAGLLGMLNYLAHLDDNTLAILLEIIAPTNHSKTRRLTVAEIARVRGVSRQAVHRKTLDMVIKYPELKSLLAVVVMKIRKGRYRVTGVALNGMIQGDLFNGGV